MLKSINAKLTASFLFILALSLAVYLFLFSNSMRNEVKHAQLKTLPIVSTFLHSEFSGTELSTLPEHSASFPTLQKRLSLLAEQLQTKHLWLITPDGTNIFPDTLPPPEKFTLQEMQKLDKGIVQAMFTTSELDTEALLFPVPLWGKQAQIVLVPDSLWPTHKVLLDFLIPTAGTGLLIGLIVLPLVRRTLRPLNDLERQVTNFATGDLSQRVSYTKDNEVGNLAKTFNMLAENVEQMTRLRRELTANISHELRSPLTRIQIAEELARMSCKQLDFSKATSHLNSIRTEVEELDGLIEEILKFSKMELNTQIGAIGACDITETVEKLIQKNEAVSASKGITVNTSYSHDCVVTCNYPMVNLAISNLLANAFKFCSENGTVTVCTMSSSRAVSINIYNTFYRRLSESEMVSIFEPFSRAEGENIPGTGLGLALVAKVAEQHDGTTLAENRGNGLMVRLTLARTISKQSERNVA